MNKLPPAQFPSSKPDRSFPSPKTTRLVLLLLVILTLLVRLPTWQVPLDRDEGLFAYSGEHLWKGQVLYRDIFEHRPPLLHFLYALIVRQFDRSIFALRYLFTLVFILTVLAIYHLGRTYLGPQAGLLAAFFYLLLSSAPQLEGLGANLEQAMAPALVAALLFFSRYLKTKSTAQLALSGALSGVALLFKPAAILVAMILLGYLSLRLHTAGVTSKGKAIIIFLIGFVLPSTPFLLYVTANQAWSQFQFSLLTYNSLWLRSAAEHNVPSLEDLPRWIIALPPSLALPVGLAAVTSLHLLRSRTHPHGVLLLAWTASTYLVAKAQLNDFSRYFLPSIPGLAMLSAHAVLAVPRYLQQRRGDRLGPGAFWGGRVALLALAGIAVYPSLHGVASYWQDSPDEISRKLFGPTSVKAVEVAAYIAGNSSPEEPIYVVGAEPEIYFLARRPSSSRYVFHFPWASGIYPPAEAEALMHLFRTPPAYLVSYLPTNGPDRTVETFLRFRDYAVQRVMDPFVIHAPVHRSPEPEVNLRFTLEGSVLLEGFSLSQRTIARGDALGLDLFWRSLRPVEKDFHVFVHLVDEDGKIWAQHDSPPLDGLWPTSMWRPGERIQDRRSVPIGPNVPTGSYSLLVGMYELDTLRRLEVQGSSLPVLDNAIKIATVRVR